MKNKEFVFFPTLIWIGSWIFYLTILYKFATANTEEGISNDFPIYFAILVITLRLAAAIAIVEICKKYVLNSNIWFLAALVFGFNAFLFINIKIWIKSLKK